MPSQQVSRFYFSIRVRFLQYKAGRTSASPPRAADKERPATMAGRTPPSPHKKRGRDHNRAIPSSQCVYADPSVLELTPRHRLKQIPALEPHPLLGHHKAEIRNRYSARSCDKSQKFSILINSHSENCPKIKSTSPRSHANTATRIMLNT